MFDTTLNDTSSSRRRFIAGAAFSTAFLAVPTSLSAPVFASPSTGSPRNRVLFQIARAQLDRLGNEIPKQDMVAIADFGRHSSNQRFHFLDMEAGTVRSFLVTHGAGSDRDHDGWLDSYSNIPNSNATSRGAYRMRGHYVGRYGKSMRMDGLDSSNSNALDRAIVMHPAVYATPAHVKRWGRLGRSNGCPAMAPEEMAYALEKIPDGRLVYADSLGIKEDGTRAVKLPGGLKPLMSENAYGRDRMLPGVF